MISSLSSLFSSKNTNSINNTNILHNFNLLCVHGSRTFYEVSARILLNNCDIWYLNRPLNQEHVDEIHKAMCLEKNKTGKITMYGIISIFHNIDNNTLSVFDGQHRISAIKMLLEHDPTVNFNIVVDVYENNNKSDEELINIYAKLNGTSKPQEEKFLPTQYKATLSRRIEKHFNNKFLCIRESKTQRPYLQIKIITDFIYTNEKIQNLILENSSSISIEKIISILDFINNKISHMTMEEVFQKEYKTNPSFCKKALGKSRENGVFFRFKRT